MANLTRIKNNQITDSTILANTKIVPGSIVGSLFNSSLTIASNVTITGNLTVQGSSTYLTVASTNTYVNDPLIVMNNAFSGTNSYDIGLLINRGDQTSTAMIWKEANKQFELTYTTDTGTTYGAINNSGYANLKVGNLTVAGITTLADIGAGNLTLSGDLAVNGGDITTTAATATVFNANATTVSAFGAATTLGIGAGTGTLTLNNATVTTPGQIISTRAGSATTGNGQIFLNGSTSNRIDWAAAGTGAPTFTTRTDGTKVVLYPALSGSTVDYAIGIDSATMWSSVPENGSSFNFKWYGAETLVANLSGTGNFTTVGDVAVNGGDLTTTAATFNLVNTDATTVNLAGAATALNLGTTTGTLTLRNPTVVGTETTQNVYNTTATTVNAFGAATTLIVGATTGIANIRNATTNVIGNATVGGTISVTGDATLTADLAVNGGDLTTSAGTFNLIDANATTVNFAGAATVIDLGATSGTLTINNPTVVGSQSTQALYNTTATTMNFAGAATTLIVGSATGVANIRNATTNILGNATVGGTLGVTGDATLTADLAVNGGDLTTSAGTFNLVNANATTVNFAGGATTLAVGATSGTLTINNPTVVGSQTTQAVFNTTATTVNAFGAASTLIVGATTGIANIRNATTNIIGNATVGGTLAITGDTTLTGDLAVNGGDITTTSATATVFNTNATTVDAFKAATDLEFGATSGTLTINNPTVVGSQTTQAVFNTTATTVNAFGAATALNVGAATGNTTVQNNLITTGNLNISATTESSTSASGALIVLGGVGVAKNLNVGGNVVVTGDLTVNGNVTTLNTATLDVEDLNITVAKGAADSAAANGAGLTVDGAGATILYTHATTSWNLNKHLIGTSAQFSTTLGVTGDTTLTADLAVNGGDLTTSAGTFNLVNANATTLNLGGAATTIAVGANSGTITIGNPTLVGTQSTQAVYNTVATTVNAFGAATTLIVGATTGVANLRNATTNILGNATVGGTLAITGDTTLTGDLAVNGGDITTTSATATVFNTNATTVDAFKAATDLEFGATTGTLTINNPTVVGTQATQALYNTTATTLNLGGAATALAIGATSGTLTINNPTVVGTQASQDLYNTTATTLNLGGAATALNIGAGTGTLTANNANVWVPNATTIGGAQTTVALLNVNATTVNAFGAATALSIGAATGTLTAKNANVWIPNATTIDGAQTTVSLLTQNATTVSAFTSATTANIGAGSGTFTINNPTLVGQQATQALYNTVATTMNFAGAATALNIGAATGTLTAKNANVWIPNATTIDGAQTTVSLLTQNATTVSAFTSATTANIGAGSGTITINNPTLVGQQATQALYNTVATTMNFAGAATSVVTGATTGTFNIRNANVYLPNATTIYSGQATLDIANVNVTTLNVGGAATTLNLGATTGTTTIRNATTNVVGNATVSATTDSTSSTTGALTVVGGVGFAKNVYVGKGATINSTQSAENFLVKGKNSTALIYANSNADSVIIGGGHYQGSGGNTTVQGGVTLKIDATDTMLLPVGSTAQRPSNSGNVDVGGMVRFNNSINNLEFYDGSVWQAAGSVFTVISDRQFSDATGNPYGNVDGTNAEFTIQDESTTAATIVSVNGVIQIPALAYDVSLDVLTFTEAPALGDVIDVRVLATTSVVSSLTSANGLVQYVTTNTEAQVYTGASVTTKKFSIDNDGLATFENDVIIKGSLTVLGDTAGNINIGDSSSDHVTVNAQSVTYTNGTKIIYDQTAVTVGTSAVVIDSFAKATYRSAKYVLSISNSGGTEFETTEVLVIHNGTTATRTQYATMYTGAAALGTVSVAVNGANVELSYTGVAADNAVKLSVSYIKV